MTKGNFGVLETRRLCTMRGTRSEARRKLSESLSSSLASDVFIHQVVADNRTRSGETLSNDSMSQTRDSPNSGILLLQKFLTRGESCMLRKIANTPPTCPWSCPGWGARQAPGAKSGIHQNLGATALAGHAGKKGHLTSSALLGVFRAVIFVTD